MQDNRDIIKQKSRGKKLPRDYSILKYLALFSSVTRNITHDSGSKFYLKEEAIVTE
jgi:hypothetical protein